MTRKIFLSSAFILIFSISSFPTAFAAELGNNFAKVDSNIRLKPAYDAMRIGYFKKGETVIVKRLIGRWCHVEYKTYRNAYVYCPLLEKSPPLIEEKNKEEKLPYWRALSFENEISLDYSKYDWQAPFAYNHEPEVLTLYPRSPSMNSIRIKREEAVNFEAASKKAKDFFDEVKDIYGNNPEILAEEEIKIPVGNTTYRTILKTVKMRVIGENCPCYGYYVGTSVVKDGRVYYIVGQTEIKNQLASLQNLIKTFKVL